MKAGHLGNHPLPTYFAPVAPPKRIRRPRFSKTERRQIFQRDGWRCVKCGESRKSQLTIDHKLPKAKGGSSHPENLQTLCYDCNQKKADSL